MSSDPTSPEISPGTAPGSRFEWDCPYPSVRMPVFGDELVATSQPLAAQAGMRALDRGGNAVDAALAAAITLTVVEPTNNGLGSDAFAIVWDGEHLVGLNASGRAPAAMTPERFAGRGAMPMTGWDAVTVPGAVSAWVALSERYGRLPFEELFEAAVAYAGSGFLVSPVVARQWAMTSGLYADRPDFAAAFLPGGRAPLPGERFRLPALARSLEAVAASRGEAFYRGELAERIAAHARAEGGLLSEQDMAAHGADWVETVGVDFAGVRLEEIPPNGQGLAALMALGMLAHTDAAALDPDSADCLHLEIEAMKLAFADVRRFVGDPDAMEVGASDLLDDAYLAERARAIDPARAGDPGHGTPHRGDTVYLCAADSAGMMVSYIQSNFFGFGSGVVVPETGISLQNRGSGFSLEPGHPNLVGPRKRPFHTIIPGFVTRAGRPEAAFGVMGGPMQPQGHVQMMLRMYGRGQNPQAAADAPRWQVAEGRAVAVEEAMPVEVRAELERRGHRIQTAPSLLFGGAQAIVRLKGGGYVGATESRKDGAVIPR